MLIITVKYEADKKGESAAPEQAAPGVNVIMDNTQIRLGANASLRPGESVEHRLRLDACGVIKLQLLGYPKAT